MASDPLDFVEFATQNKARTFCVAAMDHIQEREYAKAENCLADAIRILQSLSGKTVNRALF